MATSTISARKDAASGLDAAFRLCYKIFAYFGLFAVFGAMIYGFAYDGTATLRNYWVNLALYGAFIVPHLVMTRSWFKKAVWGHPFSTPQERRFYIAVTVITWLGLISLQRPLPGLALNLPEYLRFAGTIGFLVCVLAFFDGVSFAAIDGLLGIPGSVEAYSHGPETPLMTEGPYAQVRHPMYRSALLAGVCALLIHPNVGQLFWTLLLGSTFVAFIPVEEWQMIAARGEEYKRYRQKTPYRLFRGIW